jgi:hypothetical protein
VGKGLCLPQATRALFLDSTVFSPAATIFQI